MLRAERTIQGKAFRDRPGVFALVAPHPAYEGEGAERVTFSSQPFGAWGHHPWIQHVSIFTLREDRHPEAGRSDRVSENHSQKSRASMGLADLPSSVMRSLSSLHSRRHASRRGVPLLFNGHRYWRRLIRPDCNDDRDRAPRGDARRHARIDLV